MEPLTREQAVEVTLRFPDHHVGRIDVRAEDVDNFIRREREYGTEVLSLRRHEALSVQPALSIEEIDEEEAAIRRQVGALLASARRYLELTGEDVGRMSHGEFKPSVLTAYERGERGVSVPRLVRLAQLYRLPARIFLPIDHSEETS